ncbi:hypothetical protein IAT38_004259 [Cryptococcus sp. DSM 104549]
MPDNVHVLNSGVTPTLADEGRSSDERKDLDLDGGPRDGSTIEDGSSGVIAEKSRGVIEMESLKDQLTVKRLVIIYGSFMLLSYVLSLLQYATTPFLNAAVSNAFHKHALQASIGTVASVFQAMGQPPIAKFADYFGRIYTYATCLFFYVIGLIVIASSKNIVTYAAGYCINVVGTTGLFLLQNIIISDISSLRNRYMWTVFPNIPQVINAFVSGDLASALLDHGHPEHQWRWGFGMFCIMVPACALPLVGTLWYAARPNRIRRTEIKQIKAQRKQVTLKTTLLEFFWQLDFIGLFLFVVGFGLFFVTITTANSRTTKWSDAHSIAQLVVGAVVIVAFVVWEKRYAPHPLLPFDLLKRKTVVGACLIALFHPMGGRVVSGYLYTFLVVAAGQSTKSATRMTSFPSVAGTVCTIIGGLAARYFRVLKPFIILGICIQILFTGLMIRFRTSTNSTAELVVVQVLRGCGNGFIPYPTQAIIQAAAPHEHLAAITAGWLVVYYLAGGIGSAIGGAIWTNMVPDKVDKYLAPFNNATLPALAYSNPFGFATAYPIGTPERAALARAQDEAQRVIVIVGMCIGILALISAVFVLDNFKLPDTQSMDESEEEIANKEKERLKEKKTVPVVGII